MRCWMGCKIASRRSPDTKQATDPHHNPWLYGWGLFVLNWHTAPPGLFSPAPKPQNPWHIYVLAFSPAGLVANIATIQSPESLATQAFEMA